MKKKILLLTLLGCFTFSQVKPCYSAFAFGFWLSATLIELTAMILVVPVTMVCITNKKAKTTRLKKEIPQRINQLKIDIQESKDYLSNDLQPLEYYLDNPKERKIEIRYLKRQSKNLNRQLRIINKYSDKNDFKLQDTIVKLAQEVNTQSEKIQNTIDLLAQNTSSNESCEKNLQKSCPQI